MGVPDHFTCLLRNLYAGQEVTELDVKLTASKLGKEYDKVVYCHPASLTYMQSTSWEMPGWMNQSWDQYCQEDYQQPQICRWYHSNGRKCRGTKETFDEGKKEEWRKSWLKTQHSKNDHGIWSHHFMGNRWRNSDFIFLGSKITVDGDCSHEIKRHILRGRKATANLDSICRQRSV